MNWKKLFAMHILERGYGYYCENTVENLDVSNDIIRADVIGSEDYEVEISLSNGEVTDMYCSCPRKKCIRNVGSYGKCILHFKQLQVQRIDSLYHRIYSFFLANNADMVVDTGTDKVIFLQQMCQDSFANNNINLQQQFPQQRRGVGNNFSSNSTFRRYKKEERKVMIILEVGKMNQYVTGAVIKELREKNKMTQLQLADKLGVSDKTISKWETARGYPDITLLEPIAEALSVSVMELISGNTVYNSNVSANMLKSKFYICPICGNVIHSMGEAVIHCHGVLMTAAEQEATDERHKIFIERTEDEYYVRIEHSMTKNHYISFIAAESSDRIQMVKLYPEGNAETRFKISGVKRILFYCNRDGLFYIDPVKGIDDKESGYDDIQERRELERAAEILFG